SQPSNPSYHPNRKSTPPRISPSASPHFRKPRSNHLPRQLLLRPPTNLKLKIIPRIRTHIFIQPRQHNGPHPPRKLARTRTVTYTQQKPAFLHPVPLPGHLGADAVAEAVVDAVHEDLFD
ncbi:MAG: hypothetical protein LQ337_009016, partial [Flavoplaca oasis]